MGGIASITKQDRDEIIAAIEPFERVIAVHDALPPKSHPGYDVPLYKALAKAWPSVSDLKRLVDAVHNIKPVQS